MSCKWPDKPACKGVQISNLLSCTIMFDGETLFLDDINDLAAMAASDLLDQFRDRGLNDAIPRTVVNRTLEACNMEKLKVLIVKFKAAIQAHDAKVAAAQAAQAEREFMDHIDHNEESFASLPSCSTEMTSSGATEGNTVPTPKEVAR
jgi:hypothetical protein